MEMPATPTRRGTIAKCGGWRNLLLPQLNRQSLYVYGSEVAVEEQCMKQRESGILVIHPFSPIRYSGVLSCLHLSVWMGRVTVWLLRLWVSAVCFVDTRMKRHL